MFAQRSLSGVSRVLVATLVALAIPVPLGAHAAPPAHAAKLKRCPDPGPDADGWVQIFFRVRGVSCLNAYALARKVSAKAPKGCWVRVDVVHVRLTHPCHIGGYRCTYRPVGQGVALEATCRRGSTKLVRFQSNGP